MPSFASPLPKARLQSKVREIPLFQISYDNMSNFFDISCKRVSLPGNILVFEEGGPVDRVHLVCTGRVRLFSTSRNGRTGNLRFAEPGEMLGLSEALNGSSYEVTAETVEPTQLKSLSLVNFQSMLHTHAEAGKMVAQALAKEHREIFQEARRFALSRTVTARLARLLLDWPCNAASAKGARQLDFALTHYEIADMVGTSRETVTRLLNQFERDGLIVRGGKSLVILNRSRLDSLTE